MSIVRSRTHSIAANEHFQMLIMDLYNETGRLTQPSCIPELVPFACLHVAPYPSTFSIHMFCMKRLTLSSLLHFSILTLNLYSFILDSTTIGKDCSYSPYLWCSCFHVDDNSSASLASGIKSPALSSLCL